jgi:LPS export ABC transporter protein LptC
MRYGSADPNMINAGNMSLKKSIHISNLIQPQSIRFVAYFICLCFVSACSNDLSKLPGSTDLKELEYDRAEEVTYLFSEKGKMKARLYTREFVGNDQGKPPYMDFRNGVKLEMFDDSLNIESTVTARSARYYTRDQNVIARDSVVLVNNKGEKLQTEELIWNSKLERFYSDKFVRITKGDQISYGEGLEATQDFKWSRIKKLKGSIPVDNSEFPLDE